MGGKPLRTLAAVVALLALGGSSPHARDLSLEDRVRAQALIERVYHTHRSGETRRFDEAAPREVLERKVRDYLGRSVALEMFWSRPLTAEALHREMERIVRATKSPARLRELYGALGDDAFLVQECLARNTLVRRLTGQLFAFDERIHGELRREAATLRENLAGGALDPRSGHPSRRAFVLLRGGPETAETEWLEGGIELPPAAFDRIRSRFPGGVGAVGPIEQERTSFSFQVLLSDEPDRIEIAVYRLDKRTWEDWWAETGWRFSRAHVPAIASESVPLPTPARSPSDDCLPGPHDVWTREGILGFVEVETATAVWTGNEMIVWGGVLEDLHGLAARYDPLTDTWTPMTSMNAPEPRDYHTAVWTGSEMIVWGGRRPSSDYFDDGGRYDPLTDTWTPVTSIDAPTPRHRHTAVWTGEEMIVWGGRTTDSGGLWFDTGGRYDPVQDSWTPTTLTSAPGGRADHSAVWTGTEMIVWGGETEGSLTSSGGHYDPMLDEWNDTSDQLPPAARKRHTAVWTGTEMIVFGGEGGRLTWTDGAAYNPSAPSWRPISEAPTFHAGHAAVWTGSEMIVWGGYFEVGSTYDPSSDEWTPLPLTNVDSTDSRTAAVWTGSEMIVWHGSQGFRYDPVAGSWSPDIHPVQFAGKRYHTAVWTGNLMIVWGGEIESASPLEASNTGGRYDPALDFWDETTLVDAPLVRFQHTAVWTGTEMIVWGGRYPPSDHHNDGGRYDPLTDTWTPMTTTNAPEPRSRHVAVWTGSEMIIWGGYTMVGGYEPVGGRYDPLTDTWTPISEVDAPEPRMRATAVWTDDVAIIWGGSSAAGKLNSGGRYSPASDSWSPTSSLDAPSPASLHRAVWTGSEMLVIGDEAAGKYDPEADTWSPLGGSTSLAPVDSTAAVWTGQHMIAWGGVDPYTGAGIQAGFRFDPDGGAVPTSLVNVPAGRYSHTAVWTGEAMIVWGGLDGSYPTHLFSSGGVYFLHVDADGDGVVNQCDCAPDDPQAFDVPAEILGVRWPTDTVTIEWDSDAPNSGTGTTYDVVRGDLAELPVGGGSDVCWEPDSDDTVAEDDTVPPLGSGCYYLVRGENVCGSGGYGTDSLAEPRETIACP